MAELQQTATVDDTYVCPWCDHRHRDTCDLSLYEDGASTLVECDRCERDILVSVSHQTTHYCDPIVARYVPYIISGLGRVGPVRRTGPKAIRAFAGIAPGLVPGGYERTSDGVEPVTLRRLAHLRALAACGGDEVNPHAIDEHSPKTEEFKGTNDDDT